jgi:hypothetical protein
VARLHLRTEKGSNLDLETNVERHVTGAHIEVKAGGNDTNHATSVFEADKGWIILGFMPNEQSKRGETTYSTSMTARESHVERIEKITEALDLLEERAKSKGQDSNSKMIHWANKYVLDHYLRATSRNARFEVTAHARSREKKVAGIVVDTKTAGLKLSFTFHLMKLIAPEELELLERFFSDAIMTEANVTREFSD